MATTTEYSVEQPQPNGSVSLQPEEKQVEQQEGSENGSALSQSSLLLTHLQSYPTVNAAYNYATSFSIVRKLSSKALPIVEVVLEKSKPISVPLVKRASPLLDRADKLGDQILTQVDNRIPQLKTAEPQEVVDYARRPVEQVLSMTEAYSTAARDRFTVRVVKPIHDAAENVKHQYASVYDAKGKPLIRTRVDPLLLPLNEKFEALINLYLPAGDDISKHENELARTVELAIVAIKRAKPVIDEKATLLSKLPKETRAHVQDIYEKQKVEYAKGNNAISSSVYASIATWRQVSREGITYAGSLLGPLSGKKPTEKEVTTSEEVAVAE